ncbi:MAG: hypothetical protein RLZ63_1067 [Pseudomonadota bacterium]|jgi:cytoskeletal protein CcmA (bactofilin family)
MFTSKRNKNAPLVLSAEKFDTLIGMGCKIQGTLMPEQSLRIDGVVEGDVRASGKQQVSVVVGPQGRIKGNIHAHRVVVAGTVQGDIHASERVELQAQCRVEGDIRYGSIAVEHGACLLGLLLKLEEDSVAQDPQPQVDAVIQKAQNQKAQKPAAKGTE